MKLKRVELGHHELNEKAEKVYSNTDEVVFKNLDNGLYTVKVAGDTVIEDKSLEEIEEYFADLYQICFE